MLERCKVLLLSEINSKLGSPFLRILSAHPSIHLAGVVTSPPGVLCSYFIHDEVAVDIEIEARALNVPVYRPENVNQPDFVAKLKETCPDYLIVANFQQRIGKDLLAVPSVTALNFHPSPLPAYAGLAPFYWMVRNGERQSSISIIEMDEGLDTGAIIMQRQLPISNMDTGFSLRTRQEQHNILLLLDVIPRLVSRDISRSSQDFSKRTYFGRPGEKDYKIDLSQNAYTIQNQVRAAYRHPGAHYTINDESELTILSVALTGSQIIKGIGQSESFVLTPLGLFIRAADQWLQVLTIEVDGREVAPSYDNLNAIPLELRVLLADQSAFRSFAGRGGDHEFIT